jgi:hypothetical protein
MIREISCVTEDQAQIIWRHGWTMGSMATIRALVSWTAQPQAKMLPPFGKLPQAISIQGDQVSRRREIQDEIRLPLCHYDIMQYDEPVDLSAILPGLGYDIAYKGPRYQTGSSRSK